MGDLQKIETNGAAELVVLARTDYDRLIERLEDAEDIASTKSFEAAEASGRIELLPWEFAKRLRRGEQPVALWREYRGLTQRALAKAAGMTAAQLSEIESGKKTGSVLTLRKLAKVLNLTVDELLPSD